MEVQRHVIDYGPEDDSVKVIRYVMAIDRFANIFIDSSVLTLLPSGPDRETKHIRCAMKTMSPATPRIRGTIVWKDFNAYIDPPRT